MKKWYTITSVFLFVMLSSQLLKACNKQDKELDGTTPVAFEVPEGFPQPHYNFAANPLTKEGIELGRKLFYDGILSADGNFPCASCHQQFAAFATFDHDLSHGFDNAFTTRNAPGLFNMAWQTSFHHDGGINNIEVQALAPLTAKNEMAETVENVINKLKADPQYRQLFQKAFGDDDITSQRMLKAITQFELTMVSANSKYDKVKRGQAQFTPSEQRGYAIFQAKCNTCHTEPLFTDNSFRNNGLVLHPFFKDEGRFGITGNAADKSKFKVPSLRNVELTFPYMHDGRYYTLERVMDHYVARIEQSATLDPILKNGIQLSSADVTDIVAFLKTLTDTEFVKDPRFAQP